MRSLAVHPHVSQAQHQSLVKVTVHTRGGIPDRHQMGPVGFPRAGPGWASVLEVTVGTGSGSVTHFL